MRYKRLKIMQYALSVVVQIIENLDIQAIKR